jgi:uncharacterized metal-binding protein
LLDGAKKIDKIDPTITFHSGANMPSKKETPPPSCASCSLQIPKRACFSSRGKGPEGCPTLTHKQVLKEVNQVYETEPVKQFAYQASVQEAQCYVNRGQTPYIMQPSKTRIVEICEFARKMNYRRLGLAFCLGLAREARVVADILKAYTFEVVSVCCKAGNTSKEFIGIEDENKVFIGSDEAMCNPVFQARALESQKVEFNVLLGLCVGHDTLFFQHSDIPTTVLAVKDRVTGHNPLAAIYQSESYYRKVKYPDIASGIIVDDA